MLIPKLQSWIQSDLSNLPRRILLSGSGGLEQAIELAAALQETTQEKILSGVHTDTIVFKDQGKSFKIAYSDTAQKDGQSEHENARGLIKWMHRTPEEGTYRIAILENLERLSRESPHALLKLIEEPPKDAFLILTTRNHHQILETILSRVTVVRLPQDPNHKGFTHGSIAQQFLENTNIIARFSLIEDLDKEVKKEKDRSLFSAFSEELLQIIRAKPEYKKHLPLAFETHQSIKQNLNTRFCLERLALKMND